jgi:hypothetical protein
MRKRGLSPLKSTIGLVLTVLTTVSLAGCGGGGGNSTPATPPTTSISSIMGIGVIAESKNGNKVNSIAFGAAGSGNISPNWKRLDVPLVNQLGQTSRSNKLLADVASGTPLSTSNRNYIYLAWNAVSGARSYQVLYNESKVWDSTVKSNNDPDQPNDGTVTAYLDTDEELSGKITTTGSYTFKVQALNSSASVIAEGSVTASLGVKLGITYPTNIDYAGYTHLLSWTAVSGANGYRVQLFADEKYTSCSFDSKKTSMLFTTASYSLSGNGLSGYYYGIVNAVATDGSGNPTEINRGICGFTY